MRPTGSALAQAGRTHLASWLVELLEDYGFGPAPDAPVAMQAIASARLKNDRVDAAILAQLLRADLLPEGWIAPPTIRQLRALLRHRVALVWLRTRLAALGLPAVYRELVADDLGLIDVLQERIDRLDGEIRQRARSDLPVKVLTQLPGVGPFTALVILAEVGDISRSGSARQLASWAGLTPTVRGSDWVAHYGHISKEGSVWLRWVLCEAAQTAKRSPQFTATFQRIATRLHDEFRHGAFCCSSGQLASRSSSARPRCMLQLFPLAKRRTRRPWARSPPVTDSRT
jgi:transposase